MNKDSAGKFFRDLTRSIKKCSPEILTGVGIGGMLLTVVLAVKATPKAVRLIDEKEKEEDKQLKKTEIVVTTYKCYVPAAITFVCSTACFLGASKTYRHRNAALLAAYHLSETAFKEYKEQTLDVVGKKKEEEIRDSVAKRQVEQNPPGSNEVIIVSEGKRLCYEPLSGRYFYSTKDAIDDIVKDLNRRLIYEMQISVNEYYDAIGLAHTDVGDGLGWDIDKGYIDLSYSFQPYKDVDALVVGHHRPPTYLY
ncbi:MAG: hypothetical protein J6X92_04485 [Bacteroidales bacterium]|nr:hypothetical protein [Bacteroidales bacterium]